MSWNATATELDDHTIWFVFDDKMNSYLFVLTSQNIKHVMFCIPCETLALLKLY